MVMNPDIQTSVALPEVWKKHSRGAETVTSTMLKMCKAIRILISLVLEVLVL